MTITPEQLPALSILQPWPWAILHAGKTVENRSWRTGYRGRFLLHAGKGFDHDGLAFLRRMMPDAPADPRAYQRGGIVGMATLTDCVRHLDSPWFFGPWGFLLSDVRAIPFQPCRGALGFFNPDAGGAGGTAQIMEL